jgi:DNA polymerase (family 10)
LSTRNLEVASALDELAARLALHGTQSFKVRAYRGAARAVEEVDEDVGRLVDQGRLTEVRGIGRAIGGVIEELVRTGTARRLEQLRKEQPPGLLELSTLRGLSPKRLRQLVDELGVLSLEDLTRACVEGRVRKLPGFGQKTEQRLLRKIQLSEQRRDQLLMPTARRIAERASRRLRAAGAERVDVAGGVRRSLETVDAVDLVVVGGDPETLREATRGMALIEKTVPVRLHFTDAQRHAVVLNRATGSVAHRAALEARARERGLELRADRLLDANGERPIASERELYAALGLEWIPPELRENCGELATAATGERFDDLLELSALRGAVHCHTTYSDGRHGILAMARAAEKHGLEYITITDHSPSAFYAGGVEIDRLRRQWDEIAAVQEQVGIRILRGTESDILADGGLDYPDHVLEELDVIVASIHSRFGMDEDQMTRRLVAAMRHPLFKIWGHALGRLLLRRDPIRARVEDVLDAAAESRAAIEINGDPHRLDIEPRWARAARERGLKFVVSVDAHATRELDNMLWGVGMARRAGLSRHDVLNTLGAEPFRRAVRPTG